MKKIRVFSYDFDRNKQLVNGTLYWKRSITDTLWHLNKRDFVDAIADLNRRYEGVCCFRYFVHDVI